MPNEAPKNYETKIGKISDQIGELENVRSNEELLKQVNLVQKQLDELMKELRDADKNGDISGWQYSQLSRLVNGVNFKLFELKQTDDNLIRNPDSLQFMYDSERYKPIDTKVEISGDTITITNIPVYKFNPNPTKKERPIDTDTVSVNVSLPTGITMRVVNNKYVVFSDTTKGGFHILPDKPGAELVLFLRDKITYRDGRSLTSFKWSIGSTSSSTEDINELLKEVDRKYR